MMTWIGSGASRKISGTENHGVVKGRPMAAIPAIGSISAARFEPRLLAIPPDHRMEAAHVGASQIGPANGDHGTIARNRFVKAGKNEAIGRERFAADGALSATWIDKRRTTASVINIDLGVIAVEYTNPIARGWTFRRFPAEASAHHGGQFGVEDLAGKSTCQRLAGAE